MRGGQNNDRHCVSGNSDSSPYKHIHLNLYCVDVIVHGCYLVHAISGSVMHSTTYHQFRVSSKVAVILCE